MKKIICLLFLLVAASIAHAQTQQGIVKTNGRPNRPGTPLGNVVVKVSGCNSSLSSADGTFSVVMKDIKSGDPFFLTSVTRLGYELADKNAIGRKYGFSASVPMVLTMVSKSEVEAEKQRIRNNAIVATQKKYEQRVEELERQLEAKTISADDFGKQLQELQMKMDKYNELVENLAEKYASTDYDQIDAIDQEINKAIEEGLFDKADSLIRTKGDIDQRHQKALEWSESSKKQKAAIDQQLAQWESSEASRMKELEDLAEDYYHSFAIEVSRMQPEEAVKWLEKRVELTPDRFEWLVEVGKFYKTYLAKYDKAMEYFDRAYKIAKKSNQPSQFISMYIEKGGVYMRRHEMDKALKANRDALRYAEKDGQQYFQAIVSIYNNLGYIESAKGRFDEALEYYNKALSVAPDTLLENAYIYGNISSVLYNKNQQVKANAYIDKAINIAIQKNDKLSLSTFYSNKGVFLSSIGKEKEALAFYEKALAIQKEIFPPIHPSIAHTLKNIAVEYHSMSRLQEELDFTIQALNIYQKTYGENHPDVASCYESIALIYVGAGICDKALNFAKKSWDIYQNFYTDQSERYAHHCNTLGRIYEGMKQDSLALENYVNGLNLFETLNLSKSSHYASVLNNIAQIFSNESKYDEAIEYQKKSLNITCQIKGKENNSYMLGVNNLAVTYENSGRLDSALVLYKEAEGLILKTYGKWHNQLAANYNNVGNLFINQKEYNKAREYFARGLEICDSIYKQPAEMTMTLLCNMAMTYYRDGKWKETLPWIEKAAAIRTSIISDKDHRHAYHFYIYNCYAELTKSRNAEDIKNFIECQDSLWVTIRIAPGGVAEQKHGLSDEYIALLYGNWEQGGNLSFVDEYNHLKDIAPKDMILYKDGKIEKIHFEEKKIGISALIRVMDKQEAQTIKDTYEKWKTENF